MLVTVLKGCLDKYLKANPRLDLSAAELDGTIEEMLYYRNNMKSLDYRTLSLGLESIAKKMAKKKFYNTNAAVASSVEAQEEQCEVYQPFTHGFSKATKQSALNGTEEF